MLSPPPLPKPFRVEGLMQELSFLGKFPQRCGCLVIIIRP